MNKYILPYIVNQEPLLELDFEVTESGGRTMSKIPNPKSEPNPNVTREDLFNCMVSSAEKSAAETRRLGIPPRK